MTLESKDDRFQSRDRQLVRNERSPPRASAPKDHMSDLLNLEHDSPFKGHNNVKTVKVESNLARERSPPRAFAPVDHMNDLFNQESESPFKDRK